MQLPLSLPTSRPEERSRAACGSVPHALPAAKEAAAAAAAAPGWADTQPLCFRSEAFAEDLLPDAAAEITLPPAPANAAWRRVALPLAGVLMSALLGAGWNIADR